MAIQIELNQVFEKSGSINVYNGGTVKNYLNGTAGYNEILSAWDSLLENSYQMPAFGVSINRETVSALKCGVWFEFVFDRVYESGGLPYEKLLINAGKEYYGVNLIRYNSVCGYDGRCLYINFNDANMDDLYNILLK